MGPPTHPCIYGPSVRAEHQALERLRGGGPLPGRWAVLMDWKPGLSRGEGVSGRVLPVVPIKYEVQKLQAVLPLL